MSAHRIVVSVSPEGAVTVRVEGVAGLHSSQEILRHENRESSQKVRVMVGNPQSGQRDFQWLLWFNKSQPKQKIFGRPDSSRQFSLPRSDRGSARRGLKGGICGDWMWNGQHSGFTRARGSDNVRGQFSGFPFGSRCDRSPGYSAVWPNNDQKITDSEKRLQWVRSTRANSKKESR